MSCALVEANNRPVCEVTEQAKSHANGFMCQILSSD